MNKKVFVAAGFLIIIIISKLLFYYPVLGDNVEIIKTGHEKMPYRLSDKETRKLKYSWLFARRLPVAVPTVPPEYILEVGQNSIRIWRIARVACDKHEVVFNLPKNFCRVLDSVIIHLENMLAERFGEIMHWDEVKCYFAMYCRAKIIDVKTAKSFEVQRRGGSYHADCQPLTRNDTRIMKEIYGEWSWDRRAVIVVVGGKRIAASMSGMPHGAGLIKDNDFNGHFCVHFWGSKVHASRRVDPEHQNRVLEAAGKI